MTPLSDRAAVGHLRLREHGRDDGAAVGPGPDHVGRVRGTDPADPDHGDSDGPAHGRDDPEPVPGTGVRLRAGRKTGLTAT